MVYEPQQPPSIYASDVIWPALLPPPTGDQQVQVAVLGGGFTGVSAALNLAERGYEVHLYEAERIGYGASGRNGGQVCQGWSADFSAVMKQAQPEHRQMLWDIGATAVDLVSKRCQQYLIDADLRFGYLHAALHKRHLRELEAMTKEWEDEGYEGLDYLDTAAMIAPHVKTDAYIGGLYDANSGHMNPLKYLLGLRDAALQCGVVIHEGCNITKIDTGADSDHRHDANSEFAHKPRLYHQGGVVVADHLILAGNAYLDKAAPRMMRQCLAPVTSAIIATKPLSDAVIDELIPGRIAIADCNTALNYYRFDARGRMLFGGRASYMAQESSDISRDLRQRMAQVFPSLKDVELEAAWSGRIGITTDRIPHFGKIGQHTWFAQGFSGHGVAFTAIAAEILAEAIDGDQRRFNVLSAFQHLPFPGGVLRTPALALGMAYYKMKDKLKI